MRPFVARAIGMRSGELSAFLPFQRRNGGFPDFLRLPDFPGFAECRGHPGQKKSTLCAYQMAHPRAIPHSRPQLSPRASCLSFSSFVSPLQPLGLGFLGRGGPRKCTSLLLRRYGRRSGQPSSSSLARRACVHVLRFSLALLFFAVRRFITGTCFPGVRLLALPEVRKGLSRRPRGDGNGGRFVRSPCLLSWRGLRLYAVHQTLSIFGPCTVMVH